MARHYAKAIPADASDVDLTIANLILHAPLLPLACYIAWKHGRRGSLCWPVFVSSFVLLFISNGWKISHRNDEKRYGTASNYTGGAIVSSFMLSLIGLLHEIGIIIPQIASPRTKKTILVSSYVVMLIGIVTVFYGGRARKGAPDKVQPSIPDQFGHCLYLVVLFALIAWIIWTSRRLSAHKDHAQFRNAKIMLFTASIGVSFVGFRLLHATIFAFTLFPSLDPGTGSIVTRLVLVFFLEFAGTITLCAGGWYSRGVGNTPQTPEPAEPPSESKTTGVREDCQAV
ncbi:hypothetical protein E4U43_003629 [Claviceps pusilla]|uniref:DUF7702 domain-containing protein n=1 Tax=Claviceps pusilla TaxID=123648 RepID=A0A9P7T323_9HYPO|nr:hypothetical protein E4U43_003629 [Claviceps pusilla]